MKKVTVLLTSLVLAGFIFLSCDVEPPVYNPDYCEYNVYQSGVLITVSCDVCGVNDFVRGDIFFEATTTTCTP